MINFIMLVFSVRLLCMLITLLLCACVTLRHNFLAMPKELLGLWRVGNYSATLNIREDGTMEDWSAREGRPEIDSYYEYKIVSILPEKNEVYALTRYFQTDAGSKPLRYEYVLFRYRPENSEEGFKILGIRESYDYLRINTFGCNLDKNDWIYFNPEIHWENMTGLNDVCDEHFKEGKDSSSSWPYFRTPHRSLP